MIPTSLKKGSVGKTVLDEYEFLVIPPVVGEGSAGQLPVACIHVEDDGESDFVEGSHWRWRMEFEAIRNGAYILNVVCAESAKDRLAYRKYWRFSLPDGFVFLDAEGNKVGQSVEFRFGGAPERICLTLLGAYRTKGL